MLNFILSLPPPSLVQKYLRLFMIQTILHTRGEGEKTEL